MKKVVLAIVGLPGAGKTVASNYIQKVTGWPKIYFGQIVLDEIAKRNLHPGEASERMVRENLRKQYGMGALAELSLPKIRKAFSSSSVLVESLYSWEEYCIMKESFGDSFITVAIFASPKTRIERLKKRPQRPLSRQEVISRDYSQIEKLHQAGPIARSDFTIINEGTFQEFYDHIDDILKKI